MSSYLPAYLPTCLSVYSLHASRKAQHGVCREAGGCLWWRLKELDITACKSTTKLFFPVVLLIWLIGCCSVDQLVGRLVGWLVGEVPQGA